MRICVGIIPFDKVFEIIVVTFQMPIWVHSHKTRVLQKSWVYPPSRAWKVGRYSVDHIIFKPAEAFVHGQVIDRCRRFGGINRAAHHGHGQGQGFSSAGHQRDGSQNRNGWLTNTHDMTVSMRLLNVSNKVLYVVDVIIKMEFPLRQRNQTGIFPISDVDLVALKHGFDGVTQQGGVVPRQGGNNQNCGQFF